MGILNTGNIRISFYYLLLLIISSVLIQATQCYAQEQKQEAAVSPVSVLGKLSNAQTTILYNKLLEELSQYFVIKSQEQFQQAKENAFDLLDISQCTEDQCIRKIQEILQIENIFTLQLVQNDKDTQLTLSWIKLENKLVESDYCKSCTTLQLNQKISVLVQKILKSFQSIQEKTQAKPTAAIAPLITLGQISYTQKKLLSEELNRELTKYYTIIPDQEFIKAREKTFETLDIEQCTEDQCIRKIQEILKVDSIFTLQAVKEGVDI
ncbi:MAG: hypothetical protein HQM12_23590, partial [SAR324 cluster bacterium]|nr:hypothetical protein [SAR324 cluster bacterium]